MTNSLSMEARMRGSVNGPTSQSAMPRSQSRNMEDARNFEEKMRAAEARDEAPAEKQAEGGEDESRALTMFAETGGEEAGGFAGSPIGSPQAEQVAEVQQPAAVHHGPDSTQLEHIDRMAAAIAETIQKGAQQVCTVDFGANAQIAQSAIIARDGAAGFTIRLVTPNSQISVNNMAVLRNKLAERLERRKISARLIVDPKD